LRLRFSQKLVHRFRATGGNIAFHFFKEMRTAPAWSEVLFHLPIPSVFFHLFEPVKKLLAFLFGKVADFLFDGFHGHTLNLARFRPICKFTVQSGTVPNWPLSMELLRLTPLDGWTLEEACLGNLIEAIVSSAGRRFMWGQWQRAQQWVKLTFEREKPPTSIFTSHG
jgi:hypothetical protein